MRKFLLILGLIGTALIPFIWMNDVLCEKLTSLTGGDADSLRLKHLLTDLDADEIPILGSSRAVECLDALTLSPHAINYGIRGSKINETMFHLKRVLEQNKVRVVIVNLEPDGLPSGPIRGNYSAMRGDVEVESFAPEQFSFIERHIPALRNALKFKQKLRLYEKTRREIRSQATDRPLTSQEWSQYNSMGREWGCGYSQDNLKLLDDILSQNATIEIVFVIAPVQSYRRNLFKGGHDLSILIQKIEGHPNCRVIDLFTNSFLSDDDFKDPIHMNINGAKKMTAALKERLISMGVLSGF